MFSNEPGSGNWTLQQFFHGLNYYVYIAVISRGSTKAQGFSTNFDFPLEAAFQKGEKNSNKYPRVQRCVPNFVKIEKRKIGKERLGKCLKVVLMRFLIDSDHFQSFLRDKKKRITDPRTHGQTDGPTDGPTDKPSYRDAWTHLKIIRPD